MESLLSSLKAAYRDSNHNNAAVQVLAAVAREYALDVMELNLTDLARRLAAGTDSGLDEAWWLSELQTCLMLYADSKAKNRAAKRNRE